MAPGQQEQSENLVSVDKHGLLASGFLQERTRHTVMAVFVSWLCWGLKAQHVKVVCW